MQIRRIFTVILLCCVYTLTNAQGIVNDGARIVTINTPYIYIQGDYTHLGNAGILTDGQIQLEGDWINNGNNTVFETPNSHGAVVFLGTGTQLISGSHSTSFENITLNKTGDVYLTQDAYLYYNLTMTSGQFDLKANHIELGQNANVVSESNTNRIKSTDGSGIDGNGTGTIYTIRDNPSGNIANMGLTVNLTGNNITVARGHRVQAGTGSFTANNSVLRYFEISPYANNGGGQNITFNTCFTAELNGHDPTKLIMYQWYELYNSGDEYWHPLPDNLSGQALPISKTLDNGTLNYIRLTLGSEVKPLPVEMISTNASCEDNIRTISWSTASEQNSSSFDILASLDGQQYFKLGNVPAKGNASNVSKYFFTDDSWYDNQTIYYQINQLDLNGKTVAYYTKANPCAESEETSIELLTNPAKNEVWFEVKTNQSGQFGYQILSDLGQLITKGHFDAQKGIQNIKIDSQHLSNGLYLFLISNKQISESFKVIVSQ